MLQSVVYMSSFKRSTHRNSHKPRHFALHQCTYKISCLSWPHRQVRCDQGTNFVGAHSELKESLNEMNEACVSNYLLPDHDCEWIPFKFNTPHSSHMGSSWEHLIEAVHRALEPMLRNHGNQLDDESLRTLMTELENMVSLRPLMSDNLCESDAPEP